MPRASSLHAGAIGQQALGRGATADGNQQLVDDDGLFALVVGVGDMDAVLLHFGLADLGAEADVEVLLLELARGHLGHFGIGGGEEVRQRFEDGDLRAEAVPHAAQFQADDAGADHAEALGHGFEIERADVVDDVLAELGERQFDRIRTGGDDDVGALELDLGAVVLLHLDDVARLQLAEAIERGDLVRLEQHRDAAGELLHDLVLAADHRRDVDLRVLGADAVLAEDVAEVPELARAVEQRLRRNAAHAQAGAAQGGLAVLAERGVDARRLQAELRGADGRVIAGGAGADDDYVEVLLFAHAFVLVCSLLPRAGEGGAERRMRAGRARPSPRPSPASGRGGGVVTCPAACGAGSRAGS
jgi:hypothetical protein